MDTFVYWQECCKMIVLLTKHMEHISEGRILSERMVTDLAPCVTDWLKISYLPLYCIC